MDTIVLTRRFDLTDAQWAATLEPLLPEAKTSDRPSRWGKRQLIGGIRWQVQVGAPWCAGLLRLLAGGVRAVSPMAAGPGSGRRS